MPTYNYRNNAWYVGDGIAHSRIHGGPLFRYLEVQRRERRATTVNLHNVQLRDIVVSGLREEAPEPPPPPPTAVHDEELVDTRQAHYERAIRRTLDSFTIHNDMITEYQWSVPKYKTEEEPKVKHTLESQKKVADKLLENLKKLDPSVVLAGGAPRNWDNGKLANDLDFFMPDRPHLSDYEMQSVLAQALGTYSSWLGEHYTDDTSLRVLRGCVGDIQFDIILYREGEMRPSEYVETFNHGFNHIYYDGQLHKCNMYDVYKNWGIVFHQETRPEREDTPVKYKDWLKGKVVCNDKASVLATMSDMMSKGLTNDN